jgi:hypothetical protein
MVKVSTEFTSDTAKLDAAYDKLYQQFVKIQAKAKELAEDSERHHKTQQGAIASHAGELFKLATSYITIEKGIGFVTEATQAWYEKIERLATAHREVNAEMVKTLNLRAAGGAGPANIAALQNVDGLKTTEATRLFASISGHMPTDATDEEKQRLTTALAPLVRLGHNTDQIGSFAAQVSKAQPDWPAEKIGDFAGAFAKAAGGYFEKAVGARQFGAVRRLEASGAMSFAEGAAFEIEAASAEQPRLIGKIADLATESYDAPKKPTGHSSHAIAKWRAQQRFAKAATARERKELLFDDDEVAEAFDVKGAVGPVFENGGRERIRKLLGGLTEPDGGRSLGRARSSREGRAMLAGQEQEHRLEATGRPQAEIGMQRERAWNALEEAHRELGSGGFAQAVNTLFVSNRMTANRLFPNSPALKGDMYSDALGAASGRVGARAREIYLREQNEIEGYEKYDPKTAHNNEPMREFYGKGQQIIRDAVKEREKGNEPSTLILKQILTAIQLGNNERKTGGLGGQPAQRGGRE